MKSLIPRNSDPVIHFIVETSWIKNETSTRANENNEILTDAKSKEAVDKTFEKLKLIHENLRNENIRMRNNDHNEKRNFSGSTDDGKDEFPEGKVRNSTKPGIIVGTVRDWLLTDVTWSVPSYDLVWGAGHSYGGATIIVDKYYEEITIEQSFERMKLHENKKTGKCSDCVLVFHRIGEKLRNGNRRGKILKDSLDELERKKLDGNDKNDINNENKDGDENRIEDIDLPFESFNPFRQNGSLWVEIDCGHFYPRRDSWPACSNFISQSQKQLDDIAPRNRSAHYPNVPNLSTADWKEQYYGAEGYKFLQKMKSIWDPNDFFYHSQSVTPSGEDSVVRFSDNRHQPDSSDFNRQANKDLMRNRRDDVYSQNPKFEERSADKVEEEFRFFEAPYRNYKKEHDGSNENRNSNRDKNRLKIKKTTLQKHCTRMYDRAANADPRNLFDVTRAIRRLSLAIQNVTKKIRNILKGTPITKLI